MLGNKPASRTLKDTVPLLHIVILAVVQGITEFLPISSSGHLVLANYFNGFGIHDMTLDIAVHVGTLFAALLYFHRDICRMIGGVRNFGKSSGGSEGRRLLLLVIVGSVPIIIAGFALHVTGTDWTRSLYLLAWCTLIFGILLGVVDKFKPTEKTIAEISIRDALFIGIAQILSLVPGVSRSGITMTAARWLGFNRVEGARYSLLLAIVATAGAGVLGGYDLWKAHDVTLGYSALLAAVMAFFAGMLAIFLMLKWLERASFMPFVWYRIVLGVLLLALLYGGIIAP